MKKESRSGPIENSLTINREEEMYSQRLEALLMDLLRKQPMSFREIVCHAEGAYPTDVLRTLQDLVLAAKLEQHGTQYRLAGSKRKSGTKDTPQLAFSASLTKSMYPLRPLNDSLVFADPHPADYDWRYTPKARDEIMRRLKPFAEVDSQIALFGAPTLFLSLYRSNIYATLFDASSSLLADLKSTGVTTGLVHHNLFDPLPEFSGKYEVVVADPPWYLPFHKAFILRSSEVLKEQGTLMLSVPPWLTRPSAVADRAKIVDFATKAGFCPIEISPGVLSYQSPKFEQVALSLHGIHCGNWRLGDLFVFRKIREAVPSLKVSYPKDEAIWDEYMFGRSRVKLRHRTQADSGKLKIEPLSKRGLYFGTVSRRSRLRHRIDLWTSDNIAYSISRTDLVRVALDRLQSGESPEAIVETLGTTLSKTERDILHKLLVNITIPYEQDEMERTGQSAQSTETGVTQKMTTQAHSLKKVSYVSSFIAEDVLPSIQDSHWRERLSQLLLGDTDAQAIHLAVFVEPYLQYILDGRKTVESRFNAHRSAPYQKVRVGDILLLKRSGGPVVGLCEVASVWFYRLDQESWETIERKFAKALCVQDPDFWENRRDASYATLMRIRRVCPIVPAKFTKSDRRGWVLLTANNAQGQMELENE